MSLRDLHKVQGKMIVFGGGRCGKQILYIIKKRHPRIDVLYCFDNDPLKKETLIWNSIPCDLPYMVEAEIPILVAVYDLKKAADIEEQCKKMGYLNIIRINGDVLYKDILSLEDREYLELFYYLKMDRILDLDNPITFNEKLQWLKLYDRNPLYGTLADKYAVKDWVASRIGWEHIIPTIGTWGRFEDVPFNELPNEFVLKCTHDSGSVEVVRDKRNLDVKHLHMKFNKALSDDYYLWFREWCYKNVPRRVICEELLGDGRDLEDYKIMCFNGEPKCLFVCTGRRSHEGLHVTFFDMDWNVMPFEREYPKSKAVIKKPEQLNEMIDYARILSKGIPFVRVDFYISDGIVFFGEMTFYPGAGVEAFTPEEWDYEMGSWLELPTQKCMG